MLQLIPRPKVITFDCYGTLVQWHETLRTAVRELLPQPVGGVPSHDGQLTGIVEQLRELSMQKQQHADYCDYKSILRSSLTEVLATRGIILDAADGDKFLSYLRAIPAHPDVPAALQPLRAEYRLAIISNTDDDLIGETVAAMGVAFDFVITSQQARAYKPDHRLFLHAHTVLGVTPDEVVHVGMGQFTDLKVCHEMGIRSVWIDRLGEPLNPDWHPNAVLPDLSGLPRLLA